MHAHDDRHDRTMIHTFVTSNYLGWAELFLESLRYQHGERLHVRLDGRDLSADQIATLHRIYSNIAIYNADIDWDGVAADLNVSRATVAQWHREIAEGHLSDANVRLKLYLSVGQRYRGMAHVLDQARRDGFHYLVHSDADVYLRARLDPFLDLLAETDVAMFMRPDASADRYRVWGGFLGFRLDGAGLDRFRDRWMDHIDAVPPGERWQGFGQSALWFAVQDSRHDVAIADLRQHQNVPQFSKRFDPDADIWLGNSGIASAKEKIIALNRCWKDLKGGYPRLHTDRLQAHDYIAWGWRTAVRRLKKLAT